MVRFAQKLSYEEIRSRIIELLNTKEFRELDALLGELRYRKRQLRDRIILELINWEKKKNVKEKEGL